MTEEFGRWRSIFWPIHSFELKKIVPMFALFFLISFNYNLLRSTKETLVITAPGSGAEAILFIKSWLVLPSSILFTLIYAKLSNILSKKKLFYAVLSPFLIFFTLFALVLYPNQDLIHPHETADAIRAILPEGFAGLVAVFRNWSFALFYEASELWGSFMLALTFWGFANEITRVGEAKRFYALFGIGANTASMIAGWATVYVSGIGEWSTSLNYTVIMVVLAGFGIMAIYEWIQRNVLTDPKFYTPTEQQQQTKEHPHLSLKESFLYLIRSPYICLLAMLVIAYGFSINVIEITWKSQLKELYPNPNDYNSYIGHFTTWIGFLSLIMLFIGGDIIRRFGWGPAALVTPVVLLTSGIFFFTLVLFPEQSAPLAVAMGSTPLMMAVLVGGFQNVISKACKYSIFDPTKEMAYIPLDQEQKVKGKASIDVVAARFGKASGSFVQQVLVILFGSISAVTPILALLLIGIISIWIISVTRLNKQFVLLTVK